MRSRSIFISFFILIFPAFLVGCEESVDPVLESDEAFSFFGFFNPRADTQAIRIFPIEAVLVPATVDSIDARVFTRDMQTGTQYRWRDSVVTFSNGSVGHVFWAAFRPKHDRLYRFWAERSDGAVTSVDVLIPPVGEPMLGEVRAVTGNVSIPVIWRGVPRLLNSLAIYSVKTVSRLDGREFSFDIVTRPPDPVQLSDGSWRIKVEASVDIGRIFQVLDLRPGIDVLLLDSIELRSFVTGADWNPPGGIFDSEVLVEPGTFSNVEGGFGFVGGGYIDSFRIEVSDEVKKAIGFTVR
jgi:hypothetical protein